MIWKVCGTRDGVPLSQSCVVEGIVFHFVVRILINAHKNAFMTR